MRITENRMTELVARRTSEAQSRVAESGEELSSGLRVGKPSDDPAAWAAGKRASLRKMTSEARGNTIDAAVDRLVASDTALSGLGNVLSRARELAVQAANSTNGPSERAAIGVEMRGIVSQALAAANATAIDGQYLFAGSAGNIQPFDAVGNYVGDTRRGQIEASNGSSQMFTLSGDVLGASAGVNIIGSLDQLATALENDDLATIQASLGTLDTAIEQTSRARSSIGAMHNALDTANAARQDLEIHLTSTIAREIEADAIGAASRFAKASQSLQAAQAVTTRIIELTRPL